LQLDPLKVDSIGTMSDFSTTLMDDIKSAMKAKDQVSLTTLRALKSAIKNAAIEKGGADAELDETESLAVIRKQIKQRHDSITQFEDAGRPELADKEKEEILVLEKYLPTPLTEEEIGTIVADAVSETGASSKADMGKVMKAVQAKAEGRADGKLLSQLVMKALS